VSAIIKLIPQIKTLGMTGENYAEPFSSAFLPLFSHFSNLETLILIHVRRLDYASVSFIQGNAPNHTIFRRGRAIEKKLANAIFAASSSIVKVWIGDWSCAECERVEGEVVGPVRWKYEERVGPWLSRD
jgi:hypothetical protein